MAIQSSWVFLQSPLSDCYQIVINNIAKEGNIMICNYSILINHRIIHINYIKLIDSEEGSKVNACNLKNGFGYVVPFLTLHVSVSDLTSFKEVNSDIISIH